MAAVLVTCTYVWPCLFRLPNTFNCWWAGVQGKVATAARESKGNFFRMLVNPHKKIFKVMPAAVLLKTLCTLYYSCMHRVKGVCMLGLQQHALKYDTLCVAMQYCDMLAGSARWLGCCTHSHGQGRCGCPHQQ